MIPSVGLRGFMTQMEIRLSSGKRCPKNPRGLRLQLLKWFSAAAVPRS